MANTNAQMAEFANNIWTNFIQGKVQETDRDSVSFYRAEVVSNDGNNLLTIQRPYDNPYQVTCTDGMSGASVGMQVLVLKFGNDTNNKNHLVIANGNGTTLGSGGTAENGIPIGGSVGQALVKNSSTDYDVGWQSISSRYIHEQGTAAATWTINHNMGCFPSVTVVDSANSVIVGTVQYTNTNSLTISFNAATKGKAYLN